MNEKFSLSIGKPCSEKFSDFAPKDKGSYCNSCQKTVIDFTKMKDQEILNYFNNQKNNTCGLFLESQLKTYSDINPLINKQKPNLFVSSVFGFSLLSVLSFSNGYSQEKTKGNETVKIEKDTEEQNDSSDENKQHRIKGTVLDETGPLPGANVYLKGKNIGIQTGFDGKFTFPERLNIGDILVVSFLGLTDQEIQITKEDGNVKMNYEIKLQSDNRFPVMMMGEVNTTKVYKSKRPFFQKIKSLFTNE